MTELRKRMIECLRSCAGCPSALKKLTCGQCGNWREHYHKSPDLITQSSAVGNGFNPVGGAIFIDREPIYYLTRRSEERNSG